MSIVVPVDTFNVTRNIQKQKLPISVLFMIAKHLLQQRLF